MKYAIVMTVCNRSELGGGDTLDKTMNSLKNSGLWESGIDFTLLLHDTGSDNKTYLDKYKNLPNTIIECNKNREMMLINVINMLVYTKEHIPCDYIVYLEDDIIFCKNWIQNVDAWLNKNVDYDNWFVSFFYPYPKEDFKSQVIKLPSEKYYGTQCLGIMRSKLESLINHFDAKNKEGYQTGQDMFIREWLVLGNNSEFIKFSNPSLIQHQNLQSTLSTSVSELISDLFVGEDQDPKFYTEEYMSNAIFIGGCTNEYVKYAIAFLNSIKINYPNHPKILFHYLDSLSPENVKIIEKYKDVEIIKVKLEEEELGYGWDKDENPRWHDTYVKLRCFSENYSQYDKLLYLDIDTLVLKPLEELFNFNEFIIVNDCGVLNFFRTEEVEKIKDKIKEDGLNTYFPRTGNAGCFLVPKKYRTKFNHNQIIYLLNRYRKELMVADQSLINMWMAKNSIESKDWYKFNCQIRMLTNTECNIKLQDVHLLHYSNLKADSPMFFQWDAIIPYNKELYDLFYHYFNTKV